MIDLTLLLAGSVVMSIFICGCYIAARESFAASPPSQEEEELKQGDGIRDNVLGVKPVDSQDSSCALSGFTQV